MEAKSTVDGKVMAQIRRVKMFTFIWSKGILITSVIHWANMNLVGVRRFGHKLGP